MMTFSHDGRLEELTTTGRMLTRRRLPVLWLGVVLICGCLPTAATAAAAPASAPFLFSWRGAPAAPQPWVPRPANDWDLIANIDGPTSRGGSMEAQHGRDCSPPPATHPVSDLTDSAFICKDHMMTAIDGGGDSEKGYGAVYFTPAQLVDFSAGEARVGWSVSTYRSSARDWWDVWLTPFTENLVVPLDADLPAYQGPPRDAVHVIMINAVCQVGQPATLGTSNGAPLGTAFTGEVISGYRATDISTGAAPCVEDAAGGASATRRTSFELDVTPGHLRFSEPGSGSTWIDHDVALPFTMGVLQIGHHSYHPEKGCTARCPNTYHWSDLTISSARPFTLLRGDRQVVSAGTSRIVHLPGPAPAGSFLRFAAVGDISVSFDGGRTFAPATRQAQEGHHPDHTASYWSAAPTGTTSVVFRGRSDPLTPALPYWIEDISVWSTQAPHPTGGDGTGRPRPAATERPVSPAAPALLAAALLCLGGVAGALVVLARRARRNPPGHPSSREDPAR